MKNKLIIGKNSWIVKNIQDAILPFCEIISHKEVKDINIDSYDEIWIFSWSFLSLDSNFSLLKLLPIKKCIFISSTSVFSLAVRNQWNSYPRWKAAAEEYVISSGGYVVRLGVVDTTLIRNSFGSLPITSFNSIVEAIVKGIDNFPSHIYTLADIGRGELIGFKLKLSLALYRFSFLFPAYTFFQLPIDSIQKYFIGSKSYGYTADSSLFFSDIAFVGFGVMGSNSYKELSKKNPLIPIIVSPDDNEIIINDGFLGSRIGKFFNGLSAYWHGVFIIQKSGCFYKAVPFIQLRPRPPRHALAINVKSIAESGDDINLILDSNKVHGLVLKCKKLVLAAGPLVNCRILQSISNTNCDFSDHEIGMIGSILATDPALKNFLHRRFGLIYGRKVSIICEGEFQYMLDFRPFCNKKHVYMEQSIYDETTINIFKKLLARFSFSQLNEAFFNKFGVGISTKKISVFIQILSRDCIKMNSNGELNRVRLKSDYLTIINDQIKNKFRTYQDNKFTILRDGQHIVGGSRLLDDKKINSLIIDRRLLILGSPSKYILGASHHTVELLNDIPKELRKFLT